MRKGKKKYFYPIPTLEWWSNTEPVASQAHLNFTLLLCCLTTQFLSLNSRLLRAMSSVYQLRSKSTEFISGDSLQLSVLQTAHVEVTWCGLNLLNFNSEETKQRQSKLLIQISLFSSLSHQYSETILNKLQNHSDSHLFFYICRSWW